MHLKVNKSQDEIKRLLFDNNLKRAASSRGLGIVNENATHEWTEVSELRLFTKVVQFKPAGVNRHFNLGQLTNYMNNIHEDEEKTDFAVFLTKEDFKLYQQRKELTNKSDIILFKPAYKIRPTPEMIMAKLREFFDMKTVENHEYLPSWMSEEKEFTLPAEGVASTSVVSKEAERSTLTPVPPAPKRAKREDVSRSGSPTVSSIVRKKKSLAKDISRSSSPAHSKKQ